MRFTQNQVLVHQYNPTDSWFVLLARVQSREAQVKGGELSLQSRRGDGDSVM